MKKTKLKLVLFFMMLTLALSPTIHAQDGPDPPPYEDDGGPDPPPGWEDDGPDPPPAAPINKALPFLVVVGVAFAYKTYNKHRN